MSDDPRGISWPRGLLLQRVKIESIKVSLLQSLSNSLLHTLFVSKDGLSRWQGRKRRQGRKPSSHLTAFFSPCSPLAMSVNWEVRSAGEEAPEYLANADLFSIRIHYNAGGGDRFVGYIDYVCADQISRLELVNMGKDLGLNVNDCRIWWVQDSAVKEISTDMDALVMAQSVQSPRREIDIVIKARSSFMDASNIDVREEQVAEGDCNEDDNVLEGGIPGSDSSKEDRDGESDLCDSSYNFSGDSAGEQVDGRQLRRTVVSVDGEPPGDSADEDVHSENLGSDAFSSCLSTDEDELVSTKPKYSDFNEQVDMKDPHFKVGMKFSSFDQFKEAVRNYGVKNRVVMNFKPNSKKRCKAFCRNGCPFYLWASPMYKDQNTVQIKAGHLVHECARGHSNRHVNAKWIAKNYLEQFRADPNWKLAGIIQAVKTNQQVDISQLKAYRAKCIALRIIDGDEESQMARLYDYRLELMRSHPGSTIMFRCEQGVFHCMYICLTPLREGFLAGCRQVISLDGCFLKGRYGGQLLAAIGIDADDCTYPIAWATVDKENRDNWKWFLEILAQDLRINNSHHWVFMTDRQKGLIPAVEELFPNAEHRFCVRHIHTNFRKKFRGKLLKDQVWMCAKSSYIPSFDKNMEILNGMSKEACQYMKQIPPHHWSRAYFKPRFNCDILLNNLCESFNSTILEARTRGIVTMNEMIRTQLMIRIQKRRDAMKKCPTAHCPRIMKKLEKAKQMSWFYNTTWSGGSKYQVLGPDGQFIVDKEEGSCSCRKWQLTGIPCSHGVSVIFYNKDKAENYIADCYKVTTYLDTYNHTLNPTHDKDCWPKSDQGPMIPPQPVCRKRGKKTRLRRREVGEEASGFTNSKVSRKGLKMKCSICRNPGHNKRYHLQQEQVQGGESSGQHHGEEMQDQPMDGIDPDVLHDHFKMVDNIVMETHQEPPTSEPNVTAQPQLPQTFHQTSSIQEDPLSQVIDIRELPSVMAASRRKKLTTQGGKLNSAQQTITGNAAQMNKPTPSKESAPDTTKQHNPKEKDNVKMQSTRGQRGCVANKRKAWVPPGN